MQLYNTLRRTKETFTPLHPGRVNMYVCGITAYDYCHIGHARSALVFDVLVRLLRHKGLDVFFARNFTDIDDKIITRAHAEGRDWREVAQTYMQAFHEDMDALDILRPDTEPCATDYIGPMLALCATLIKKGHAYATPTGDVYFRVRSFAQYGALSGRSVDELQAGARVAPGEEKEDPLDFALWKAAKPGEPFWESDYGNGRPGWHIECSAMNEAYLPLDIHGGGQDLIFPHHENEIAQTEAATGQPLAHFWVHNGFVQIDAEKMSKSLGNFTTIREILRDYLPETLRFFLLGRHYRSPVDYTADSMDEAERAQRRVYECLLEADIALQRTSWKKTPLPKDTLDEITNHLHAFDTTLDDDCNTAGAIGHIFVLVRLLNKVLEDKTLRSAEGTKDVLERILAAVRTWHTVLGLFGQDPATFLTALRDKRAVRKGVDVARVTILMEERTQARANKDFARSDALRADIAALGVELRDTPQGVVWDIA